uniref:Trafficking protein particle complex subunit 11 domain-containing protein n=1 Tax=Skeletonema marinoi TaxID=267567 RepID=A0A7S2LZA6_9STRA|mmetsp:Transcript_32666/g.55243  ORF Transcript_32666/g.55243 Transcript_32666/m.55243 type:complete len:1588 (+) Transcript_32666:103-4866(+)
MTDRSSLVEGASSSISPMSGAANGADIRPVIYVVNATVGGSSKNSDDEPGNLQPTRSGEQDNSLYQSFLTALQSSKNTNIDETISAHSTVGRWRQSHGSAGAEIHTPSVTNIAIDVDNDSDASTAADPIYSKDNPQINFMSRRARVISVNRRYAFPPSKCPQGKMNGMSSMIGETQGSIGNAWLSSYNVQNEGILPEGWVEKHTNVLPSALVVVTTINETSINNCDVDRHVIQAVEDFRMTLSEKRSVPIHLVCLTNCVVGGQNSNRARDQQVAILKEKICEECYLPQSQVYLLNYPTDLEPDEFETAVLRSPYRSGTQDAPNNDGAKPVIMNPHLRQLDRSLRDSSALYYSRLAEAQERKLSLWRNRYHSSNSSFEVNTLIAGIRCARYALKVATLREFQMRTGAASTWSSVDNGGAKWTDKGSLCMRFYEEAYRWVIEMHRRAVTWRATSNNSGSDLMTPRNNVSSNQGMSPNITQSPGGGIGVELPLPSFPSEVPEPPSMVISTPPTGTSAKGSGLTKDIVLYTNLWQQCRAVASIINSKLLCIANASNSSDTVNQWKRHRLIFLASPQGIRDYNPNQHDDFFGPLWYRMLFATEELHIYACTVEEQLRREMMISSKNGTTMPKPSYHQTTAPWKIYSELAEAIMGLGAEMKRQQKESSAASDMDVESLWNFVGSKAAGEAHLKNESQRDHKGIALEYILHALELFEVAKNSAEPLITIGDSKVTSASVRLHYLAGRLLMSIDNPVGGAVHLKIAADRTKNWPSLQLSIQRALRVCEERCLVIDDEQSSKSARAEESRISCAKLLFEPETCAMLSDKEIRQAQNKSWELGCKDIVWKDDASGKSRPPFDFALSFLESTHATSGDSVWACLSIKTHVDFQLFAKTIKLITSVGNFKVSSTDLCFDKAQLQSWLKSSPSASGHAQVNFSDGVQFTPNEVAFILTEISLPTDFSSVALGGTAIGNNFYTPKSGKITNMGLTHAAGNICESLQEKVTLNGKPVPISSLPESSASFLGGIPFVCHGVEMELGSPGGNTSSQSNMRLRVEKSLLLTPLGRSGNQQLQMEECGYMAHAWSRPDHQLWCLGPRCLRILGPRPQMDITNLTEPHTNGIAIEGTVNRIMFQLQAGADVDCRGVRLSIRCRNSSGATSSDAADDLTSEGVTPVEPGRSPFFVKRSDNDNSSQVDEEDNTPLPKGWEPRKDVSVDESSVTSSVIAPHLEAGKSMLLPLDLFRPLHQTGDSPESDSCMTSYEITISYRQVRTIKGISQSSDLGDQVVVIRSGTVTWISPFTAEFSPINGNQKNFPCGIKHSSNMVQSASNDPSISSPLIAADGERIRMRCHLKAKELGSKVAANIEHILNENEPNEEQKYLYSSADSNLFFAQSEQGSKLSLAYSITAKTSANVSGAMCLGAISIGWKPAGLSLSSEMASTDGNNSMLDEFGLAHGPLILSNIAPMKFYGPRCHVLDAPFKAKMLKCPSAPKVGTPFRVSYQVTNQTAKSQTLQLSMNSNQRGDAVPASNSELLIAGKMQGEAQMGPWEEKVFSFTFMSMIAGKVSRPQLSVSSGRHQTWVINESNNLSSQTLFVLP